MNVKFVLRGFVLALLATALFAAIGLLWIVARTPAGRPPDPTPPPPTILAPRGELPTGPSGLEEWLFYSDGSSLLVGSGFFLALDDGEVIGVTTAHSVAFGERVERIGFRVAGQADFACEFDTLRGRAGRARWGADMTVDYVLLHVGQPVDPALILAPDARGAPQPGERVTLFSGLGDGQGNRRLLEGTVQSVEEKAVWVLMDDWFDAGRMSGSPFISQHTGKVVGMVIAIAPRRTRLLMGMHPIGSILRHAAADEELIPMKGYRP